MFFLGCHFITTHLNLGVLSNYQLNFINKLYLQSQIKFWFDGPQMFENWEHRQDVDEVMLGDAFLGINCQQLKINDYLTAKNHEIL